MPPVPRLEVIVRRYILNLVRVQQDQAWSILIALRRFDVTDGVYDFEPIPG